MHLARNSHTPWKGTALPVRIRASDGIKRRQQRYAQDGTPFENSHLIDPDSQCLNTGNTDQEWTVTTFWWQ
jgi:hypothetical protein